MQYFGASLLTLWGLVHSLQCTEVNGGYNTWSNSPRLTLEVHPRIEEWQRSGPGKKLVLHKKNEPLNMTCTVVYQNGEKDGEAPFDYTVDWKAPRLVNPKISRGQSKNTAWIWFERLAERDSGDYTCIAVANQRDAQQPTLSVFFYLFVEHKPTYCGDQWFRCNSKNCIMQRYVCDGKPDCEEGEDESSAAGCGPDPCLGKVLCEDRCMPPDWCCGHRNCSGQFGLRPYENHEISYVQTAFYTVIGCAMAFMFIVTILVIAICRVQIKRAMNSRCSQRNRNVLCGRRTMPLYDLDVYLDRTADINYPGGVSIMYNINSGVQFVGRPAEPPPYSEVIAEPPREGPPPPYVSCENLIVRVPNPRFHENDESLSNGLRSNVLLLNRSIGDSVDDTPPDTDIRSNASSSQISGGGNAAAPQVPSSSATAVPRPEVFPRDLQSRDGVDGSVNRSESLRRQQSTNFELEYVETDALLSDNSRSLVVAVQRPKDAITWKPYSRHALIKSRWLNGNERREKCEKNWHRQRQEKNISDHRLDRESTSHKDSENEGVFLDQQDSTNGNDSPSSAETDTPSQGFASVSNSVEIVPSRVEDTNFSPGCSNIPEHASPGLALPPIDPGHSPNPEDRREDSLAAERDKRKSEIKSGKPESESRHFLRGMKRQISLNNEATASKSFNDTSVSASTRSVDLPNPRLDDDRPNTQIRQSSLVLPLRESFIGVQRDS